MSPSDRVESSNEGSRRLRRTAGLTLLAIGAIELGIAALALRHGQGNLGSQYTAFGLIDIFVLGVPTLAAAIASLRGVAESDLFALIVSIWGTVAVGFLTVIAFGDASMVHDPIGAGVLVLTTAMTVGYGFAAVVSFLDARRT